MASLMPRLRCTQQTCMCTCSNTVLKQHVSGYDFCRQPEQRQACKGAYLCTAGILTAISAALAVELSTICASSKHTRHQRSLVRGVGITCKMHHATPGWTEDKPRGSEWKTRAA